jgi:parallel beta-helix repeat protein
MILKRLIWILTGLFLVCFCVSGVSAAGCSPGICNTNQNGNYATIQEAIDAASAGDIITVDSGTYSPFVVNKPLTIQGIDAGSGLPVVQTPGYSSGNTIEFAPGVNGVTLDGFSVTSVTYGSGPTGTGIYINPGSSSNVLSNIAVKDFDNGIYLEGADHNNITTCTATGNRNGIYIVGNSLNNTIDTCTLTNGAANRNPLGVGIVGSSNNTVRSSTISDMLNGIKIIQDSGTDSTNNTIQNNSLTSNDYNVNSMALYLDGSNNHVNSNFITENPVGITLYSNGFSNIITNNYFNQSINVNPNSLANIWNTGAISPGTNIISGPNLGGNYWATPDGNGWSQTCTDADTNGICDLPYTLDGVNIDNFPLTNNAPPATITGTVLHDLDYDGVLESGEPGLEGWTVYLDNNGDNEYTISEPLKLTDIHGNYSFSVEPGTYVIREILQDSWGQTAPSTPSEFTIVALAGQTYSGNNFGNYHYDAGNFNVYTCRVLDSPGTYTLQNDILNSDQNVCIDIKSRNVIFDGNDHTISGIFNVAQWP